MNNHEALKAINYQISNDIFYVAHNLSGYQMSGDVYHPVTGEEVPVVISRTSSSGVVVRVDSQGHGADLYSLTPGSEQPSMVRISHELDDIGDSISVKLPLEDEEVILMREIVRVARANISKAREAAHSRVSTSRRGSKLAALLGRLLR